MGFHTASTFSSYLEKSFLSKITKTSKFKKKNSAGIAVLAGSIALANGIFATASEVGKDDNAEAIDLTTTASINPDIDANNEAIQFTEIAELNVDTLLVSVIQEADQQLASLDLIPIEDPDEAHESEQTKLFSNSVTTQINRVNISDPSQPNPDIIVEHDLVEKDSNEQQQGDISIKLSDNSTTIEVEEDGEVIEVSQADDQEEEIVSQDEEPDTEVTAQEDNQEEEVITQEDDQDAEIIVQEDNSDLDSLFGDSEEDTDTEEEVEISTPAAEENNELGDLLTLDEDFFSDIPDSEDLLLEEIGQEIEDGVVQLDDFANEDLFSDADDLTISLQNEEETNNENQFDTTPGTPEGFETGFAMFDTDPSLDDVSAGLFG